jgi:uncharacterized protein YraI
MNKPRCPRCNELILGGQPVHWACFFERAYRLILLGLGSLLIPACVILTGLFFLLGTLPASQSYQPEVLTSATPVLVPVRPTELAGATLIPAGSKPTIPVLTLPVPQLPTRIPTLDVSPTFEPTALPLLSGTVNTGMLNLREGPSKYYSSVDQLPKGTNVVIVGRNGTGTWLKVSVPSKSKQGWVSTDYIETSVALDSIPLTDEPPPPPPTPTPVPRPIKTATPLPPAGVVINYYSEQDVISPGSCTVLHWGIENVQEVYLDSLGVQGWDQKRVCPKTTTTYTLRIVLKDGSSIERRVVVRIQ